MSTRQLRILLADDHPLVRNGIRQVLSLESDMEVVGEAGDGLETLRMAQELRPDVILLDLALPRRTGLEILPRLREELPETAVIILTYSTSEQDAMAALQLGAAGYLVKSVAPETLAARIREALRGDVPVSGSVVRNVLRAMSAPPSGPQPVPIRQSAPSEPDGGMLSPREIQILRRIAAGNTNREIAEQLGLSENTVKNYVKSILAKLNLENRVQAAAWALSCLWSVADGA
ncbi:response regulator [Symbiobacterium terraclitae]|uniref:response regulator n=1 Tax=Symbiobacterium terraclitae TaxID=557451 RepID=UPI0035B53941